MTEIIRIKSGENLNEVWRLRQAIFGCGEDDLDECAISVMIKEAGEPAALGRILLDLEDDRLVIDEVGVLESSQGKGYARLLIDEFIKIAMESESKVIWAKSKGNPETEEFLSHFGFETENYYWMTLEI